MVGKGKRVTLKATLFDQYLRARTGVEAQFFLARDLAGAPAAYDGVTLSGGTLTLSASSSLQSGDIIVVVAKAGSKQAAAFIKVE